MQWIKASLNKKDLPAWKEEDHVYFIKYLTTGWEKETGGVNLIIDLLENGWPDVYWLDESPKTEQGESYDLLKKKVEFYREQTDKVRELISSRTDIGEPCQPLYDAIFDKITSQEKEIKRLIEAVDWKVKYEKCIAVIKRIDAGIIGFYDL